MKKAIVTALALIVASSSAACSEKQRPAGTGNDDFDTGLAVTDSEVRTDSNPLDTGSADSGGTDSGGADSETTPDTGTSPDAEPIDTAPPADTGPIPDGGTPDAAISGLCPKGYAEVPGTAVTYAKSSNDLLAGLTWDELTMAWATTSAGKVTIQYADRTSRDAAFGAPQTLPDSLGPFDTKVAFSADGLTMLIVSADNLNLRQITRTSRSTAFAASTATSAPFAKLIGTGSEPGSSVKKVSDVVLSKDGNMLWYTDVAKTSGSSLRVSFRSSDGTFDAPNAITTARLEMVGTERRRPTGISGDGRVLFFWDESDEVSYSAFRAGSSIDFSAFYALAPNGKRAMPSDGCDRFYASLLVAGDKDGGTPDSTQIFRVP